jgi:hypothetical protein
VGIPYEELTTAYCIRFAGCPRFEPKRGNAGRR